MPPEEDRFRKTSHDQNVNDYFHQSQHRERQDRPNVWWVWVLICSMVSACTGSVIATAVFDAPENWATKLAAAVVCLWSVVHVMGILLVQHNEANRRAR